MNTKKSLLIGVLLIGGVGAVAALLQPVRKAWAYYGQVLNTSVRVPCWLRKYNTVTPWGPGVKPEIIIGRMEGRLPASGFADAYYDADAGDCDFSDVANTGMPTSTDFMIRLEGARAIDVYATTGGNVIFALQVIRKDSCSGSVEYSKETKSYTVAFGTTYTYDWVDHDPWASDLSFTRTTPSSAGVSHYWYYTLTATVIPTGGSTSTFTQSGCFVVST